MEPFPALFAPDHQVKILVFSLFGGAIYVARLRPVEELELAGVDGLVFAWTIAPVDDHFHHVPLHGGDHPVEYRLVVDGHRRRAIDLDEPTIQVLIYHEIIAEQLEAVLPVFDFFLRALR